MNRLILFFILFLGGCSTSYKERTLSIGSFELSQMEALELRPDTPLVCSEDTCAILLDIKNAYTLVDREFKTNGSPLNLQIDLATPDGRRETLAWQGSWGRAFYFVLGRGATSNGFSAVRITSNLPVVVHDVRWVTFKAADVKR